MASSTASASPTGASVLIVDDHPADRRVSRVPVLLVEDNEVNQRVARHMLRKSGYLATVVENGEEAIAAVMRERFDIVLMDVQMPVLGGLEAARRIRELEAAWTPPSSGESSGNSFGGRRLQIIAMTAYAMKGDRELCLAAGMDDYVAKPIKCQRADRIGNKSARTDISITLPADHRMSIVLQHRRASVLPKADDLPCCRWFSPVHSKNSNRRRRSRFSRCHSAIFAFFNPCPHRPAVLS